MGTGWGGGRVGTRLERDMGLGLWWAELKRVGLSSISAFEHRVTRARQARLAAGAVSG